MNGLTRLLIIAAGVLMFVLGLALQHPTHPTPPSDDPPLRGEAYPSGPPIKQQTIPGFGTVLRPHLAESTEAPDTVLEVAMHALQLAYTQHPHGYEYCGVIVKMPNGKFNGSAPLSGGDAAGCDIDYDPIIYAGEHPIVADYHTHPCMEGYISGLFSPQDLRSSRQYRLPGYLLDECTGDVHYWAPGDPTVVPPELQKFVNRFEYNAVGKIVGHIQVDGKVLPRP